MNKLGEFNKKSVIPAVMLGFSVLVSSSTQSFAENVNKVISCDSEKQDTKCFGLPYRVGGYPSSLIKDYSNGITTTSLEYSEYVTRPIYGGTISEYISEKCNFFRGKGEKENLVITAQHCLDLSSDWSNSVYMKDVITLRESEFFNRTDISQKEKIRNTSVFPLKVVENLPKELGEVFIINASKNGIDYKIVGILTQVFINKSIGNFHGFLHLDKTTLNELEGNMKGLSGGMVMNGKEEVVGVMSGKAFHGNKFVGVTVSFLSPNDLK